MRKTPLFEDFASAVSKLKPGQVQVQGSSATGSSVFMDLWREVVHPVLISKRYKLAHINPQFEMVGPFRVYQYHLLSMPTSPKSYGNVHRGPLKEFTNSYFQTPSKILDWSHQNGTIEDLISEYEPIGKALHPKRIKRPYDNDVVAYAEVHSAIQLLNGKDFALLSYPKQAPRKNTTMATLAHLFFDTRPDLKQATRPSDLSLTASMDSGGQDLTISTEFTIHVSPQDVAGLVAGAKAL